MNQASVVFFVIIVTLSNAAAGRILSVRPMTFNAALLDAPFVTDNPLTSNRLERRAKIIETLQGSKADIICMQEAWFGEDVEAIVEGVLKNYPMSYSAIHNNDGTVPRQAGVPHEPPCDASTTANLFACVATSNCSTHTDVLDLVACAAAACNAQFLQLLLSASQDCFTCLIGTLPFIPEIFSRCATVSAAVGVAQVNNPGLLLLSKKHLTEVSFTDFFPTTRELINRGYLSARVGGKFKAVCTHVTSPMRLYLEPDLGQIFASQEEQQLNETKQLVNAFRGVSPLLLFGDFNTGLPGDGVLGYFEENYKLLTAAFPTLASKKCTFCPTSENVYNTEIQNVVIDHIFANGFNFKCVRRVFTPDKVNVGSSIGPLPVSDHFGVEAIMYFHAGKRVRNEHRRRYIY